MRRHLARQHDGRATPRRGRCGPGSEADDDIEAPVAPEDEAGLAPAHGHRGGVGDFFDGQAVGGEGVPVERDVQGRQAPRLLGLDVGGARDGLQDRADSAGGAGPGDALVEVHLDRSANS